MQTRIQIIVAVLVLISVINLPYYAVYSQLTMRVLSYCGFTFDAN